MKYSIYNSRVLLTKNTSMLYNAMSDSFLLFRKSQEWLLGEDPRVAESEDAGLYAQLLERGFVVDDSADETAEAVRRGTQNCESPHRFRLTVNPTTNCNFRCWYCYETHSPQAKMSGETVRRVASLIKRIARDKEMRHISLSFFGGEPLLYYKDTVEPLIDALRAESEARQGLTHSIHFTSNGFLLNDRVLAHLTQGKEPKSFQITLDGGKEKHDRVRFTTSGRGSYDRIVENIKRLLGAGINVGMRINYTRENMASVRDILADIKGLPAESMRRLDVDFQRVWQEKEVSNDDGILNETVGEFRRVVERVSTFYNHTSNFANPCYADMKNECVVNHNGDVYKCTARDFTPEHRLGSLGEAGEIVWDDPRIEDKRIATRLGNKTCRKCRLFPLCGGSCSQNAEECGGQGCVRGYSELEKDKIILMRFHGSVVSKVEKGTSEP